jgi:hypothetical protein
MVYKMLKLLSDLRVWGQQFFLTWEIGSQSFNVIWEFGWSTLVSDLGVGEVKALT